MTSDDAATVPGSAEVGPDPISPARLPTAYLTHGGGPCFFMDWDPPDAWDGLRAALEGIAPSLPRPPRAILVTSSYFPELLGMCHSTPVTYRRKPRPARPARWSAEAREMRSSSSRFSPTPGS